MPRRRSASGRHGIYRHRDDSRPTEPTDGAQKEWLRSHRVSGDLTRCAPTGGLEALARSSRWCDLGGCCGDPADDCVLSTRSIVRPVGWRYPPRAPLYGTPRRVRRRCHHQPCRRRYRGACRPTTSARTVATETPCGGAHGVDADQRRHVRRAQRWVHRRSRVDRLAPAGRRTGRPRLVGRRRRVFTRTTDLPVRPTTFQRHHLRSKPSPVAWRRRPTEAPALHVDAPLIASDIRR